MKRDLYGTDSDQRERPRRRGPDSRYRAVDNNRVPLERSLEEVYPNDTSDQRERDPNACAVSAVGSEPSRRDGRGAVAAAVLYKIPYPPSVNHIWTRTRNGATLSKEYKSWRESCLISMYYDERPRKAKEYDVRIILFPKDERTRDIDNSVKAIFDLMTTAGVWDDDKQVARLGVERGHLAEEAFAVVYVGAYKITAPDPEVFDVASKETREEYQRRRKTKGDNNERECKRRLNDGGRQKNNCVFR